MNETAVLSSQRRCFRLGFVPPWKFWPRSWFGYIWPQRITLTGEGRAVIYRWLWWNVQTWEGR